jgi:hypothetical protein
MLGLRRARSVSQSANLLSAFPGGRTGCDYSCGLIHSPARMARARKQSTCRSQRIPPPSHTRRRGPGAIPARGWCVAYWARCWCTGWC